LNFREHLGVKPIKVPEGAKIDVLVNCANSDQRYTPYGDYGRPQDMESIEGQEIDFEMGMSSFNQGNTEQYWG
jgi:hypothetical protein